MLEVHPACKEIYSNDFQWQELWKSS